MFNSKVVLVFLCLLCVAGCNAQFGPTPTAISIREVGAGGVTGSVITPDQVPGGLVWHEVTKDPTTYQVGKYNCVVNTYGAESSKLEIGWHSAKFVHQFVEHLPGAPSNIWHVYQDWNNHEQHDLAENIVKTGFCCTDFAYFRRTGDKWEIGVVTP